MLNTKQLILAGSLALAASAANAELITFQVCPSCVGEPQANFAANYIDFSYSALVDQTVVAPATGTFTEEGAGFFSSYRYPTLSDPVIGTGLNDTYKMYAVFNGGGTVSPSLGGGINVSFTSFSMQIWVDTNANTTLSFGDVGGVDNDGLGDALVFGNTADDIMVGATVPGGVMYGEAHVFPGLAAGDFDVLVEIDPTDINAAGNGDDFFQSPLFMGMNFGDFNGVNTVLEGFSPFSFVDGKITGSGNLSFVPEPTTLALLGLGLVGLSVSGRRK
ncbi:MAG: flocculation-associated PEP-CTERM protein PepA [Gammaproteobacteria bacterium]|nr:flocculation-associated PEP-CTERM protein PepA [Gammaproteobacteria bacterium]MDH5593057.1 flocculation-associated PEP-CTERM protein PepA [Gammaproteobacteria bacterium]MDH5613545.1 flocculation-associated PEP-CTERM protein PepA [Gammaproteobacteria bacterium]